MWHKRQMKSKTIYPKVIRSASQAIDELGGTARIARLFGCSYRVVSNWRPRGLPPDTYYVLAPLLIKRRCLFSPLLFGQRLPAVSHVIRKQKGIPACPPTVTAA